MNINNNYGLCLIKPYNNQNLYNRTGNRMIGFLIIIPVTIIIIKLNDLYVIKSRWTLRSQLYRTHRVSVNPGYYYRWDSVDETV